MQDIRYHIANTLASLFLAYMLAITVNQIIRFVLTDFKEPVFSTSVNNSKSGRKKIITFENNIQGKGFFVEAPEITDIPESSGLDTPVAKQEVTNLILLGTITGPRSIARALIKNKSEKKPQVFKLYSDVYGYKLHKIKNFEVHLKTGEKISILNMYGEKEDKSPSSSFKRPSLSGKAKGKKGTISRAELNQKMKGSMDQLLKGIRVGPYRVNGKIQGFKLFKVRPSNFLYELGARSGDVVKRINGQPINSTEQLYKMWQSFPTESQAIIHIKRGNDIIELNYSITD